MKDVRIKVMQTGSNSSFKVVYEEEGGSGRGYMYMLHVGQKIDVPLFCALTLL